MIDTLLAPPEVRSVTVDPATAARWLEFNTRNRNMIDPHVQRMAGDMVSGRWRSNGETIKFDREGRLIDGQHRLAAVVAAQVAVPMLVVSNLEPDAQLTIDIGSSRTTGQQLGLMGVRNVNTIAAGAVALWKLTHHPDKVWNNQTMPSKPEQIEFIRMNLTDLYEGERLAQQAYHSARIRTSSYMAVAVLAIRAGLHAELLNFHDGIITGASLKPGDPRLALRSRSIAAVNKPGAWEQQAMVAIIIKAFNAYREGRDVKLLRFTRNELPMPIIGQTDGEK